MYKYSDSEISNESSSMELEGINVIMFDHNYKKEKI